MNFGGYFHERLYLDGTVSGDGRITGAWPDELSVLPDGTEVSIVVIRTSGSATYVSTPRSAIVVG